MSKQTKQTKQTKQAPARKQRNTLLTIALAIVLLHGLLMFAIFWTVRPEAERTWTNIAVWLMIFSSIGDVVAAAAMWYWKRWGIYLYGVAAVAAAIVAVMASGDLFLLFGALLPAIVVLYIVAMQRDKFV
jgi:cytochrome bd-type quinol oxidase subunit 2